MAFNPSSALIKQIIIIITIMMMISIKSTDQKESFMFNTYVPQRSEISLIFMACCCLRKSTKMFGVGRGAESYVSFH